MKCQIIVLKDDKEINRFFKGDNGYISKDGILGTGGLLQLWINGSNEDLIRNLESNCIDESLSKIVHSDIMYLYFVDTNSKSIYYVNPSIKDYEDYGEEQIMDFNSDYTKSKIKWL